MEVRIGSLRLLIRLILIRIERLTSKRILILRLLQMWISIYLVLPLTGRIEIPRLHHFVLHWILLVARFCIFVQICIMFLMLIDISKIVIFKIVVWVLCCVLAVWQALPLSMALTIVGWPLAAHASADAHADSGVTRTPSEIRSGSHLLRLIVVHCQELQNSI